MNVIAVTKVDGTNYLNCILSFSQASLHSKELSWDDIAQVSLHFEENTIISLAGKGI